MAEVEEHATLPGEIDLFPDLAVGAQGRIGKRLEAVGQHVTPPQARQHLPARGRRVIENAP